MRNSLVIAIYLPFFLATAVACAIELSRKYKRKQDYLFCAICLCALGWYAATFIGTLTSSAAIAEYCINLIIVFVGYIPPILLLFVIQFYRVTVFFPRWAFGLIFVIPCLNIVMAGTADWHTLLNEELEIISLSPVRRITLVWGIWFWIHTVYSYILSVVIIALIITEHFNLKRFYRRPSTILITGVLITLFGNVITLLQILPPSLDPTLLTMSLSVICFSVAIINNSNSRFVRFSRAQIYNYMKEMILVLDDRDQVIDANRAATDRFAALGISLEACSFGTVTEALERKGQFRHYHPERPGHDVDIHLRDEDFTVILNQRGYSMRDITGDVLGKLIIYTDVTENRMLIERLETKAHMDPLTGIPNRSAYEGASRRLAAAEYLPLGVIVCDINNLKTVNDTMGHKYGDMLIRAVGELLEEVCPREGFVARVGGDEFIYLLPSTSTMLVERRIDEIRHRARLRQDLPFAISVAVGGAIRTHAGEDIALVMSRADERMYEDKKNSKSNRREAVHPYQSERA